MSVRHSSPGLVIFFFLTSAEDMFVTDVREEGIERHRSVASCTLPDQELNPQPFGVWVDSPTNRATWLGQLVIFFYSMLGLLKS